MNFDIFKVIGVAFVTAISAVLLKSAKPEMAFIITIAGIIVIVLSLVSSFENLIAGFHKLFGASGVNNSLLKLVLKIVGVGYITEFAAGLLNDFGSSSVADKVILAGKLSIVVLSLPVLENLLSLIKGFLDLV